MNTRSGRARSIAARLVLLCLVAAVLLGAFACPRVGRYLVVTEPIPAGASVLTESISGTFDRYEIEPFRTIAACFAWGAIGASAATTSFITL